MIRRFFELYAGYCLGASSIALFGRICGGIYSQAASVGADLVGKTLKDTEKEDPSSAGVTADNVGSNVRDVATMGADLLGSLAETTCAVLLASSASLQIIMTRDAVYFPLMITAAGIVASFISVLTVHTFTVT